MRTGLRTYRVRGGTPWHPPARFGGRTGRALVGGLVYQADLGDDAARRQRRMQPFDL